MGRFLLRCLLLGGVLVAAQPVLAQRLDAPQLDQGFEVTARPDATGEERARQPDLYMLELDFKPIRLRSLPITDPETGRVARKTVYYLVYRLRNKPLQGAAVNETLRPANQLDQPYTNPRLIPELTLLAYRGAEEAAEPDQSKIDVVLPEAIAQLSQIERRRGTPEINDSIQIIQPLPEPAEDFEPIYGMATWTDIDPETDYVTVLLRGFTNAYETRQTDDGEQIFRKVLVLKLRRRGDEFEPDQREFEFDGDPEWRYLPAESNDG